MEGSSNVLDLNRVNETINELRKEYQKLALELKNLRSKRDNEKKQEEKNKIAVEILNTEDRLKQNVEDLQVMQEHRDKTFGFVSGSGVGNLNRYIENKLNTSNPNLAELIELEEYVYKEIVEDKGVNPNSKEFAKLYENIKKINQRICVEANIIETANYTGWARTGFGFLRVFSGRRNEKTEHKDPDNKSLVSMKYHILHEQMKMKSCLENQDTAFSRGSSDNDVKIFANIMTETVYGRELCKECNDEFKELIAKTKNGDDDVKVKDFLREAQNSKNDKLTLILNDIQSMDNQKYVKYGSDLYREEKDSGIKYLGQEQTKKYLQANPIRIAELYKLTEDSYLEEIIRTSRKLLEKLNIKSKEELKIFIHNFLNNIDTEKDDDGMDQTSFADVETLNENDPKRILHDIICENGFYLGKDITEEPNIENLTNNKSQNQTRLDIISSCGILITFVLGILVATSVIAASGGFALIPIGLVIAFHVVGMIYDKIKESRGDVEQNVAKSIEKAQEVFKNRGKEAGLNAVLNDVNQRYGININLTPEERKQLFDNIKDDKESSKILQQAIMNKIYNTPEYKNGLQNKINEILESNGLSPIKLETKFNSIEDMEGKLKEKLFTDLMNTVESVLLDNLKKLHPNEKEGDLKAIITESMKLSKDEKNSLFNGYINEFNKNFIKIAEEKYNLFEKNIEAKLTELKENKSEVSTDISDTESENNIPNNTYKNNPYKSSYANTVTKNKDENTIYASNIKEAKNPNMIKTK